jgi:hypothetical protein
MLNWMVISLVSHFISTAGHNLTQLKILAIVKDSEMRIIELHTCVVLFPITLIHMTAVRENLMERY